MNTKERKNAPGTNDSNVDDTNIPMILLSRLNTHTHTHIICSWQDWTITVQFY